MAITENIFDKNIDKNSHKNSKLRFITFVISKSGNSLVILGFTAWEGGTFELALSMHSIPGPVSFLKTIEIKNLLVVLNSSINVRTNVQSHKEDLSH
jgi:hypothetical protein